MLRKYSLFLCILFPLSSESQESDSQIKSIHQTENEYYNLIFKAEAEEKSYEYPSDLIYTVKKIPGKKIFGWHPYWAEPTAHLRYDYELLTHIAWFSYEVDTATGGYITIHNWNSTPLIDYAHQNGTKVILTVTNFGTTKNTEILTDTLKQKFMISTLISLLKTRNGDGVNIDFESIGSSQRQNLVSFMERTVRLIKKELPDAEISITVPAVDWNNSFDLKELSVLCSYILVMTYDYYWSGSSTAGPVAPISGESYNVTRTINTYLSAGLLKDKFLMGIPWYGYDWPVVSSSRKSAATGKATAKTFSTARQLVNSYSPHFDETTKVPWISYLNASAWRQMWYEDSNSLLYKYKLALSMELGGIGIWALSYEGIYQDVWSTMMNAFAGSSQEKTCIIDIFPNPSGGDVEIRFFLAAKSTVSLIIYDMTGKERMILPDTEFDSGQHSYRFDSGNIGQGVYVCVMRAGNEISSGKLIITR